MVAGDKVGPKNSQATRLKLLMETQDRGWQCKDMVDAADRGIEVGNEINVSDGVVRGGTMKVRKR